MRLALLQPLKCLLALGQATIFLSLIALLPRFSHADEPYFPDLLFSNDRELNNFKVDEYTEPLKAMKEPSLWRLSKADREITVYRLLWLKDRRHPISVRITKSATGAVLLAVELDGFYGEGYKLGKVTFEKQNLLTAPQWKRIEALVDAENPWFMPVGARDDDDGDGRLLLECVAGGKYHVVDRPYVQNRLSDLQRMMLELSGLEWQPPTYFPPACFTPDDEEDNETLDECYSSLLFAMKEPSLWKHSTVNPKDVVLRLLWIPVFRHPISIRVVQSGNSVTLFGTELDGAGCDDCDPGQVTNTQIVKLTSERWTQILEQLDRMKLATMPALLENERRPFGKRLLLELVREGRYHAVNRFSGKGELARFCRVLLELPELKWSIKPFITNAVANSNAQDPDFLSDGHHDFLWVMNEPSLRTLARVDRTAIAVRFLYLPSFRKPFSVRMWKDGEALKVTAIQLDGQGGPGRVVLKKTARLTGSQWDKFMRELDRLTFWEAPSNDPRDQETTDPDHLTLEQARLGKHHFVERRTPIPDDYIRLFESMIAFSGVDRKLVLDED